MKKIFSFAFAIAFIITALTACSKSNDAPAVPTTNYASGQGVVKGSGAASFDLKGSAALFSKRADTIQVVAIIDSSASINAKSFRFAMVAKGTGTVNFDNFAANTSANFTSGGVALYLYETVNGSGTIIAHLYASQSGTINISSFSSTQITGTYSVTMADINNNNDPVITVTGSFAGNF